MDASIATSHTQTYTIYVRLGSMIAIAHCIKVLEIQRLPLSRSASTKTFIYHFHLLTALFYLVKIFWCWFFFLSLSKSKYNQMKYKIHSNRVCEWWWLWFVFFSSLRRVWEMVLLLNVDFWFVLLLLMNHDFKVLSSCASRIWCCCCCWCIVWLQNSNCYECDVLFREDVLG